MNSRLTTQLPDALLRVLQNGCPALLLTVGEDGFAATAFTWAAAVSPTAVRFGADLGSTTLANLERQGRASLQIIAEGNLLFLIKGATSIVNPRMAVAPYKVAMMELKIVEVKDQSWPEVSLRSLGYEWASDQRERMLAMEQAVYAELRAWKG